ncbi:MAG: hypothetical protein KJ958_07435 [Gammaproteobacteria bacterium]|uniref:Uncharacterized protein n=1 Tax=Sulfuricella denitrificans (strain DSM 22764 / NBRC 105220 / skB26) TaxID=1163617 RepID=S6AD36_SULDS|nr:hypothetical protein [Sulfuricella denitrificans]MBU1692125.1 hypothetical protein [Gammaproteobacteria bacterium]MBU1978983.1 hypothetical protein [Gammaproteobacteria bacterium]BAN36128.1 hypothetical protein SCD_n02320 [Sulfuricella denitrificans skB26]
MPYFVYKITPPFKQLERIDSFPNFKEASAFAKTVRTGMAKTDNYAVKVIFAENELEAEDLLTQVREPEPMTGEDY